MAEQDPISTPGAEPPQPAQATPAPAPATAHGAGEAASAALHSAQDALSQLSTDAAAPPPKGEDERAAAALRTAQETVAAANAAQGSASGEPVPMPTLKPAEGKGAIPSELELLSDVSLQVKIELGRTKMLVEDVLRLNEGSVVELDKLAGDPVDVYVNNRHVARGEVLVVNENFCVRISEIVEGARESV